MTPPFPIIVGSGRSGTTLLRAMLNSHPELSIPPESHFIPRLGRRRARYELDGGFAVKAFVHDLARQRRFKAWDIPEEDVRRALDARPPRDLADAIRSVFALYAERNGKSRSGDKTPNYVAEIDALAALLPDARFVHLIRDGRDVTLSYLDRDFGPGSVVEGAVRWRALVKAGRRAGVALGPERYLELRYEELVAHPEASLRALSAFLDLSYEPSMLHYHDDPEPVLQALDHSDHSGLSLPPTQALRDWRVAMAPHEVWAFDALAGELLSELGYPRAAPDALSPGSPDFDVDGLLGAFVAEVDRLSAQAADLRRRRREAEERWESARGREAAPRPRGRRGVTARAAEAFDGVLGRGRS